MAPHSSPLAWKIPWTEEPGGLQSMGSWRVGHDWATSLSLFAFMHWRRKWQPTPAFLPGESQGWGSLVGCRLWGGTEPDTTEATSQEQQRSFGSFAPPLSGLYCLQQGVTVILTSVSLYMCVFFVFGCFYYLLLLLSNFIKTRLV